MIVIYREMDFYCPQIPGLKQKVREKSRGYFYDKRVSRNRQPPLLLIFCQILSYNTCCLCFGPSILAQIRIKVPIDTIKTKLL